MKMKAERLLFYGWIGLISVMIWFLRDFTLYVLYDSLHEFTDPVIIRKVLFYCGWLTISIFFFGFGSQNEQDKPLVRYGAYIYGIVAAMIIVENFIRHETNILVYGTDAYQFFEHLSDYIGYAYEPIILLLFLAIAVKYTASIRFCSFLVAASCAMGMARAYIDGGSLGISSELWNLVIWPLLNAPFYIALIYQQKKVILESEK